MTREKSANCCSAILRSASIFAISWSGLRREDRNDAVFVSDLEAEELPSYHRNIDMDEVMLTHADEDSNGRRPGSFRHTPQGILHGANEAHRAEFQVCRKPGMRRTGTSIGVDTYRPLKPSPEFMRMSR